MDEKEWARLKRDVGALEEEQKRAEEREAERQGLHSISQKMVETWPNTLINIRKKKEMMYHERLQRYDEWKAKMFQEARELEEKAREEIRKASNEVLYQKTQEVKMMNTALRAADVWRVRQIQKALADRRKAQEDEIERNYAEQIKKDAELFKEEEKMKRENALKKKLQDGNDYRELLRKRQGLRNLEKEEQVKQEILEREEIQKEIAEIKAKKKEEMDRKKNICKLDRLDNLRTKEEEKQFKEMEEKEENEALEIVAKAKRRIMLIRREKEAQAREEALRRTKLVGDQVNKKAEDKEATLNRIQEEGAAKHEEMDIQRSENDKRMKKQMKQDRIHDWEAHNREKREIRDKKETLDEWDMLQRYKRSEINQDFYAARAEAARGCELKEIYKLQAEENCRRKKKELDEDLTEFTGQLQALANVDNQLEEYVKEIIEDCKKNGRLLYPIEKTYDDWKRSLNLHERKTEDVIKSVKAAASYRPMKQVVHPSCTPLGAISPEEMTKLINVTTCGIEDRYKTDRCSKKPKVGAENLDTRLNGLNQK